MIYSEVVVPVGLCDPFCLVDANLIPATGAPSSWVVLQHQAVVAVQLNQGERVGGKVVVSRGRGAGHREPEQTQKHIAGYECISV